MATKKTQFSKVKNTATTKDNDKKTFIKKKEKYISKKEELNKPPDIEIVI